MFSLKFVSIPDTHNQSSLILNQIGCQHFLPYFLKFNTSQFMINHFVIFMFIRLWFSLQILMKKMLENQDGKNYLFLRANLFKKFQVVIQVFELVKLVWFHYFFN